MFEQVSAASQTPERGAASEGNFYTAKENTIGPGMNPRIQRLRKLSVETEPSISIERALHQTECYRENYGKYPIPVLRALTFLDHCQRKTLYIGDDELIVGERGPSPKAVPTFPELTCHSVEDLHVLNTRDMQRYITSQEDIDTYEQEVIPYWQGRSMRDRSPVRRSLGSVPRWNRPGIRGDGGWEECRTRPGRSGRRVGVDSRRQPNPTSMIGISPK